MDHSALYDSHAYASCNFYSVSVMVYIIKYTVTCTCSIPMYGKFAEDVPMNNMCSRLHFKWRCMYECGNCGDINQ
jgi:hypothetical protein